MELSMYSHDHDSSTDWIDDLLDLEPIMIDEMMISEIDDDDDNDDDDGRQSKKTNRNTTDQEPGQLICVVCGDEAHGHNFDQLTCESCKAFFRRNALKDLAKMKCRFSGCCQINPITRRLCSYCRLKKCFEMKMRKDWIRTDREKQIRALFKRVKQLAKTGDQETTSLSIKDLQLVQRRKKRLHPPKSSLTKTMQTLAIHRDLSEVDRILVNNVCGAYAKTKDLVDFSHITNPEPYKCMRDFLNHESRTYQSFIHFLKNIQDFHDLDLMDQILLVKRNSSTLIFLHHVLASGFYEHPFLQEFGEKMMGYDFQHTITTCRMRFDCFMKYPQVMMLSMIMLAFGVNLSTPRFVNDEISFKQTKKIASIQDFYLEILWKYLLNIFNDETRARRSLQVIVTQILRFQTINSILEDHLCSGGQPPSMHPLMESVYRFT